jgi:hypothetical protein
VLCLRVTRVVALDAAREQTFPASLASACERSLAALCPHTCAESMLAFARALAWLIGSLHTPPNSLGAI